MTRPLPAPRLSDHDCARLCFMVAVIAPDADEDAWFCDECLSPLTDEDAILCAGGSIRCSGCDEATIARDATALAEQLRRDGCSLCADPAWRDRGPSHNGSSRCEPGSIASGGRNAHCACDVCF